MAAAIHVLSPAPPADGFSDAVVAQNIDAADMRTESQLYLLACAGCHAPDGTGLAQVQLGFEIPMPDFTDCRFAAREPDSDWFAVTHEGGPARAFDRMMPAFGESLTDDEIQAILDYVRSLCTDHAWPRGELNLPRAMFTAKAYPEDEAVWTTGIAVEGPGEVSNELTYEFRVGARNQIEFVVPFEFRNSAEHDWRGGIGDISAGFKRVVYHSLASGTIVSLAGEVILPTGDLDKGFGAGVTRLEPFIALGQVISGDGFLQFQTGAEIPTDSDRANAEAFWRSVIGRSFTEGRFGRTWSPMVEVLGARELTSGVRTRWDIVPQFQVTLNRRQHVMANIAVRVPLTDTASRNAEILFYVLLDWFDGGLFEGW